MGRTDEAVFAAAQLESRVVVTENVPDYRLIATRHIQRGNTHHGLVLTSNRRFPRHRAATAGRLVLALDALLSTPGGPTPADGEHWLA